MIDRHDPLSVSGQSRLLGLSRSGYYYTPKPVPEKDLGLMRQIDEHHTAHPSHGSRRIQDGLSDLGVEVGRDHVRTLMRKMGFEAVYRKPRLSAPNPAHKIWPYLLRHLPITRANQVWATDITYIPMYKGFAYLVAIMDWASRRTLAWRLSNTMDTSFCVEALEEAIEKFGTPEIFNTDQGSQFTSEAFTGVLLRHGIKISMDGKGRWVDNVFVERLWRSLKYEEVYLKAYGSMTEAREQIGAWFAHYNLRRRHQGLNRQTPDQVYWSLLPKQADVA